jgi:hypothetical protein
VSSEFQLQAARVRLLPASLNPALAMVVKVIAAFLLKRRGSRLAVP